MEEPKEQVTTSTQVTQSVSTPGVPNASERILIGLMGVLITACFGIAVMGILSGKTAEAMTILATLAGNVLSGILALMVSKRT